ncbi:hypothetical protein MNEG_9375 [Monoraphidium neglectum]|uniref:Uncharacterized protein n=1 Tax=Monoraphidium neglectum TaxID=145388 RepID=A0A0D2MWC2_9CHLO|nr:hypothetical protein MNEG_9375 [Monoraphidium neglectum]KIY98585.1 hypothetical protein MNEG_9375 [Monoraphidium neglectum]|eukprot:XP_013897605.1 hypothetical protein MNEG_9375 [Monoraphidium neglectum]
MIALIVLMVFLALDKAEGFKEHEFKKCKDASFCDRNRGKAGRKFTVDPASVAASGAALSAALISDAPPAPGGGGGAAAGPPRFNLTLLSYGGTVRLLVDEPGAGRYQAVKGA